MKQAAATTQPMRRQSATAGTLEAMRLGVVPRGDIASFTVGRDEEMQAVDADLARAVERGGALRTFLGNYGTGKTHLLQLIAHRALDQNFLVARAVLDPEESPPSHPKRVYRELVRSLRYPDRPSGGRRSLEPLLERAAETEEVREAFRIDAGGRSRNKLDEGAHLYLTPALRYAHALKDDGIDHEARAYGLSLLYDWLEGHPTISNTEIDAILPRIVGRQDRIYSMKDYRPWARIYGYILSGLSVLARRAGYAGLVLLVDEAEFYSLLSTENREYARTMFKALAWASLGADAGLLPFDRSELDLGGMGILKDLPAQFAPDAGLYTVFAMTPHEEGIDALGQAVPDDFVREIAPLRADDYRTLVTRVFETHRQAHPDSDLDNRHLAALTKVVSSLVAHAYIENPRQAMKFVVEFLDLATTRRDRIKDAIAQLKAMYLG
jgi:hypothetical protein